MVRTIFAACLAVAALAACQPSLKVDKEDPWATLYPWDHKLSAVKKIEVTGKGAVDQVLDNTVILARAAEIEGAWLAGGELKWTSGANEGKTSKVVNHEGGFIELEAAPEGEIATGDTFEGKAGAPVEYVIISEGEGKGPNPGATDMVEVHYEGRFASNGEVFDSSYERGETASFPLNGVIKGWTEGLQKMKAGDQVMFWIPWQLAYGEYGRPGGIPPKSDLMFRVELITVTPAAAPNLAAWEKVTPWPTDSSEIIRTASGLEYLVVDSGPADAASPTDNDYAYVHFQGRLDDGSIVDSTFESQRPQPFPVADLVPGWNEALKLMRKGDRWMVRVPAHLMYGDEGDGRIPPGAAVIFEVLLEDVIVIEAPQAAPAEPQQ